MSQRILEGRRKEGYVIQLEKALCVHLTIAISQQPIHLVQPRISGRKIILSYKKIFQLQQGLKICGLQDWIHKFLKWFQRYADFLYDFVDFTRILPTSYNEDFRGAQDYTDFRDTMIFCTILQVLQGSYPPCAMRFHNGCFFLDSKTKKVNFAKI